MKRWKKKLYEGKPGAKELSAAMKAAGVAEQEGNIDSLVAWAGDVGFTKCVLSLEDKPGIVDPERLCGWLKARSKE